MESQSCDPYEQRLLSVYESCLEKNESSLTEKGLRCLCDKLQLEERGNELISNLLNKTGDVCCKITFQEFRDGLLNLLDSTQNLVGNIDDEVEDKVIETSIIKQYGRISSPYMSQLAISSYGDLNVVFKNNSVIISDGSVKRMLEQLFQKLDTDGDGLITFNEFLMLFQNNGNNLEDTSLGTEWSDNHSEDGCKRSFTMMGPDHTGFIERRSVINLWQLAGVSDAIVLLNELSITDGANINLSELISVLTQELQSLAHEPKDSEITNTHLDILRATLILYQEEVRSINVLIDQLTRERDKLKIDVAEANERANILAQEIDENHAKLEKSKNDQIKLIEARHSELVKDFSLQQTSEREAHMATLKSLNEQLQACQQEEQLLRGKLADALHDNQTLEIDNQNLTDQINKLKISNNQLLIQVQALAAECDEAEHCDERENEQVISLVDRIKKLQSEASLLRDQNDELTSEIELLKSRLTCDKINKYSMTLNNSFADSTSDESNSVTDYEPLGKQVPEFKIIKETDNYDNDRRIIMTSNLPNAIASIINDLKNLPIDCSLKRNISDIISELESHLDKTKVSVDGDKNDFESEITKADGDKEECEERTSSLRDFVVNKNNKRIISQSDEFISSNIDNNNYSICGSSSSNNISKSKTSLRDYPPRKESWDAKIDRRDSVLSIDVTDGNNDLDNLRKDRDRLSCLLQEQEVKHNNEKKLLQEQCKKLETDLELLRNEYYQCEDYWENKLEEERLIVEQEQKITDDKLTELINKIAEYEEQFSGGDKKNDGRLSPIDEKFNLEQSYTDLEDEFEEFKRRMQETLEERESELMIMQEKLKAYEKDCVDTGVQVPDDDKSGKKVFTAVGFNYVLPNDTAVNLPHFGHNSKSFERGKLNKITEHVPDVQIKVKSECYCQQLEHPSSADEFSRLQKTELQRMLQKKTQNAHIKCTSLMKQKDCLVKEIMELQNFRNSHLYQSDGQSSKVDINFIKSLMTKVQVLDEKKRNLQISLKHQKQHTDKVVECIWKQHYSERSSLEHVLKETQASLKQYLAANKIQMQKLAKSDLLIKDLYVENTHLKAKVDRLSERCIVLENCEAKSTSV
ncbi:blastoderm-specific protein 25D [Microplitis demolitor]|uniref:blastoderm-specific protein 25D n=1 Tax=Microplitis demolitor TaxID=69319 RepID=UPI00044000CB|nr:blastoderm-specific protein 25D [Microplitis demolitor]